MVVRVLAFARIRELLEFSEESITLAEPTSARELWNRLVVRFPKLAELADSTRVARNGKIATFDDDLRDGDEVALLPPVGGG